MHNRNGFTLAELLIALVILGVIATFTIPKVLQSQQSNQYKAIGKEAASMISGAYQAMQADGKVTTNTRPTDFSPYMNYVSMDTTGQIDDAYTSGTRNCTAATPCLNLHNGSKLYLYSQCFGGTTDNVIFFNVDPDGKVTDGGSPTNNGKSLTLILYYNGQIVDFSGLKSGSTECGGYVYPNPWPGGVPPWFSWN